MKIIALLLFLVASLTGGQAATNDPSILTNAPATLKQSQFILAWDRSSDDTLTNGLTYVIHGEQRTATATNLITVANITSNTVGIYDIVSGDWTFYATAKLAGIESESSNLLLLRVPVEPLNMKTVILQYSATLDGPFVDALFLKLRPLP